MTAEMIPDDAFQRCADEIQVATRRAAHEILQRHLRLAGEAGEKEGGPLILAAVAGMLNGAGYFCGEWGPFLNGDVISGIAQAQFDSGREDHALFSREPS